MHSQLVLIAAASPVETARCVFPRANIEAQLHVDINDDYPEGQKPQFHRDV